MAESNTSNLFYGHYQEIINWEILSLVNNSVLCTLIGLMGLVANVINMVVFVRQGLNTSMNISFFSIAISDITRILLVEWANICFNPYVEKLDPSIVFDYVFYLTGGWPVSCACRITLHISLYITIERCLCIVFPLKIKKLITITRTKLVIVFIYFANILTFVPEYMTVYLGWVYDVRRNSTVFSIGFRENYRQQTKGIIFLLHVVLIVIGLLCIIVMTTVLVLQLRRKRKWRMKNSSSDLSKTSLSTRDRKAAVLVIAVATAVAICYIPIASLSLATVFVPDFYIGGKYFLYFKESWSIVKVMAEMNRSNIFYGHYQEVINWEMLSLVNNVGLCTLIGLMGLVDNVINMVVFEASLWLYDVRTNATVLGVGFRAIRQQTKGITFLLHVLLILIALFCHDDRTRAAASTSEKMADEELQQKKFLTSRDRRSAVLVITVATVVCYIPIA
uniref:G-protein coupled receptors family 1 profile domain-containing protein n=1 Tax=Biomphalaria glabrata TaxID=6526 RepID=A0A2C9LKZ9_BIOGL